MLVSFSLSIRKRILKPGNPVITQGCFYGDEADSQDSELAARLSQAATQPTSGERQSFRGYLRSLPVPA